MSVTTGLCPVSNARHSDVSQMLDIAQDNKCYHCLVANVIFADANGSVASRRPGCLNLIY